MARILVLGIGNVLMGDDALGSHVIKELEARYTFPDDVTLIDAGTPGVDLTAYMAGHEALLVVDVVRAKGQPGEFRYYDKEKLLEKAPIVAMSPHEPGLREALLTADFMGVAPAEVKLIGVIPDVVDLGVRLSDPVRAALPRVIDELVADLAARGAAPTPRDPPAKPDLWWETARGI